jgi:hypothetical protein
MDRCKKKKKKKKQTRTVQKLNNKRVSRRNRTPALPYSSLLAEVARLALRNANRITSRQFQQKFSQNDLEIKTLHKTDPASLLSLSSARARSLARAQTLGLIFRSWRESSECTTLTCGSAVNPGDFTPMTYGSSLNPADQIIPAGYSQKLGPKGTREPYTENPRGQLGGRLGR